MPSTRARFGAKDSRYKSTIKVVDALYRSHERDFGELYRKVADLSRTGKYEEALPIAKRAVEVGKGFEQI